jgi:Ni/Co efflux regulator RcnB
MSVDRKNEATDREDANLSRRSFLVGLTVVGIGSAIAMSLGVNAADAAAESEMASGAKDLTNSETWPESKMAEVVQQVDPNDPLQHFNQPYYRHRRRVARRVYRRGRRVYRRYRRRGYYY